MNQRWNARKTTRTGITIITPKAKIWPQSKGGCPWNTEISRGSGRTDGLSTIRTGHRNEPHALRNCRIVTVAKTGFDMGTTMRKNVFHGPAPSTRAASSSCFGKPAKNVKRENAYDYVAGYTVANDYAIRDYLENYYRPNLRVKSRDSSTPLGPWLVDRNDVADPMNLTLQTSVNGTIRQEGSTRDMIFTISSLIEYLSGLITLQAGDLILTGTPEGLADVKPGDEVVTEIEGIGRLVNTIV